MKRHKNDLIIKVIFNFIGCLLILVSSIYFLCSLLIDKIINYNSIICSAIGLLFIIVKYFVRFLFSLSKKNIIIFFNNYFVFNNQKYCLNECNFRYFKLYISVIDPTLVFPTLHINARNLVFDVYLSKKDINKIIKMGYDISVNKYKK